MTQFIPEKIEPFDWEELDGKTLHIRAARHEGAMIVVGKAVGSEDVYVLYEEISKDGAQ